MVRERIVWVVTALVLGGIGFYGGQMVGSQAAMQGRARAAQDFLSQRGGQGAGGGRGGVFGTVKAVSGSTVTVETRGGQTVTVQLAPDVQVRKQTDGALSDIKEGETIAAMGTQQGGVMQASSVQIGGLGGLGGPGAPGGAPGSGGNPGGGQAPAP